VSVARENATVEDLRDSTVTCGCAVAYRKRAP
jgi:hypothetical protein